MESSAAMRLMRGLPPSDSELIEELSVGLPALADFWQKHYLNSYIRWGGSKVKFLTGGPGSGKSHCLELLACRAAGDGYVTVSFSAGDVGLHDFKAFYVAALRGCDIDALLALCADRVITEMGFRPKDIPEGVTFVDCLAAQGQMDPLTRRELRRQIGELFLKNPLMDNNFARACALLIGAVLGHPPLEAHNKTLLLQWLHGEPEAKLSDLRKLGLSPARINKTNARHMLRSLCELIRLAGRTGLFIAVDNLDALLSKSSLQEIHYTKLRREDTYESIRELIDEIDTLRHIMVFFAFGRALMEDEAAGLKSYQALWMRLQNEIRSERFNRFADIADLDVFARQAYSPEALCEMSARLARVLDAAAVGPITPEMAAALVDNAQYSHTSLPLQVSRLTRGLRPEEAREEGSGPQ
jgi:hypothetical protein